MMMGDGMSTKHGWIGVDLDGTLAEHYWSKPGGLPYDELVVGAPILPMVRRVNDWIREGYEVRIFTARVAPGGSAPGFSDNQLAIRYAIERWCFDTFGFALAATCVKDYQMIELWDDRAVRVIMDTGEPCCHIERELRR
jgi:hypothetical protein